MKKTFSLFGVFALLASLFFPIAGALNSITFTTTGDFDSGVKEPTTILTDYFASNGISAPKYGPVTYPSSLYDSESRRTFVVWSTGDPDPHSDHDPMISYYDHLSGKWGPQVRIAHWILNNDDHGVPVILMDDVGIIHIFGGSHGVVPPPSQNGDLFYSKSYYPRDISQWVSQPPPVTGKITYPKPIMIGSSIYIFYRNGTSTTGNLSYIQSLNHGSTWSSPKDLVNFGTVGISLYQSSVILSGTRVFFSWIRVSNVGNDRTNVYVGYLDLSTGHMFCLPGTDLGLVIDQTESDASCRIFLSPGGTFTDLPAIRVLDGNPYVIFGSGSNPLPAAGMWKFIRWTGSAWTSPQDIVSTDDWRDNGDFIIKNSSEIRAFLITPGGSGRGGNMEQWNWNGATWSRFAYILNETDSGKPLARPSVPFPGYHPNGEIYFTQELVDDYRAATQRLYVWGENGFLKSTRQDYSVETSTDSGKISSGAFELRSQYGDAFTFSSQDTDTFLWTPSTKQAGGSAGLNGETNTQSTKSGLLFLNTSVGTGSASLMWGGVLSKFNFSSDFDLQFKLNPTTITEGAVRVQAINENILDYSSSVTVDGSFYQLTGGIGFPQTLRARIITNGIDTDCGDASYSQINQYPVWLRISRAGTSWTFRYSLDGSSWTTDKVCTFSVSGNLYVDTLIVTGATLHTTIDNFIFTGSINGNAFLTSGSWSSPLQTDNTQVPTSVTISYTGATAGRYIDQISFVSKSQGNLFVDNTHHPSGTEFTTIIPTDQVPFGLDDWYINVRLHGDGSGSVSVADITINTGHSSLAFALFDAPWLLGLFALLTLGLVGAFAIKRKRSGH